MKDVSTPRYFVYTYSGTLAHLPEVDLPPECSTRVWRPSVFKPIPPGPLKAALGAWVLFHALHVFTNREYGQLLIYDRDVLAHRSGIFPGWLRFPFMGPSDLQIGDTWTHPDYRGLGMARFAIREIVARYGRTGRTLWYIVESQNRASIRAVELAGFVRTSNSVRTTRLGSRLLGAYSLTPGND